MNSELSFLGTFGKLWKVTLGFIMSLCISILMEKLSSFWTDFDEIAI
jgi:hypothetical protein